MSNNTNDVRNSREDALSQPELRALIELTEERMSPPFREQCMVILVLGGVYGMRATEIAHMQRSWIDYDRDQIRIPKHEPCECDSCRQSAKGTAEKADDTTFEEAFERRWNPKTDTGARTIPLDFDAEAQAIVYAFFEQHDEYPRSRTSLNRRVDRICETAGIPKEDLYPHALRATASTWHSYEGLSEAPLKALMGWKKFDTAEKYVRHSGGATARALADVHGGATTA